MIQIAKRSASSMGPSDLVERSRDILGTAMWLYCVEGMDPSLSGNEPPTPYEPTDLEIVEEVMLRIEKHGVDSKPINQMLYAIQRAARADIAQEEFHERYIDSLMAIDRLEIRQMTETIDTIPDEAGRIPRTDRMQSEVPCYVTLNQMAAMVSKSKRTLERQKRRVLPEPDVRGGPGRADEWKWSTVRPLLEEKYGRRLPADFPSKQFIRR